MPFRSHSFRALLLSVFIAGAALHSRAQNAPTQAPPKLFDLQDARLNELSGLASSKRYPNHFWAHNDSGDAARLFLLNARGETVATVNLAGVSALDFEDMARAKDWIYLGDIGDNARKRSSISVHRLREPFVDTKKRGQEITISSGIETQTLNYPDGPRDCETLAAAPDGRLLFVDKNAEGSNFYLSSTPFQNGSNVKLQTVARGVKFGQSGFFTKLTTAGDFSPNGRKLLVSTYSSIYEWPLNKAFDVSSIQWPRVQMQMIPSMKQSESACYSLDGKRILVSSEGEMAPVYALDSRFK